MRRSTVLLNLAVALTAWAAATPAAAQPLGQATRLLCSTASAVVCYDDGECESGPSWLWNIPDFVEVDLEAGTLTTTVESPRLRVTPIDVVRRGDELLLLQGLEGGRAYSIAISEEVGSLSAAIILENLVISIFGACTPVPEDQ